MPNSEPEGISGAQTHLPFECIQMFVPEATSSTTQSIVMGECHAVGVSERSETSPLSRPSSLRRKP